LGRNKVIFLGVLSAAGLVQEYLVGYLTPPALRDLEHHCAKRKGVTSWRFKQNHKSKVISQRHGIYQFIDKNEETAVQRPEDVLETTFHGHLPMEKQRSLLVCW
jgi:hypothetical protein